VAWCLRLIVDVTLDRVRKHRQVGAGMAQQVLSPFACANNQIPVSDFLCFFFLFILLISLDGRAEGAI